MKHDILTWMVMITEYSVIAHYEISLSQLRF